MRVGAFFIGFLVLLSPLYAEALVRPPLSVKKCPAGGSSEAPPRSHMELTKDTVESDAEKFLNTAMYCPNACYNLRASLTLGYSGITVEVLANDACKYRDKLPNDPAQGTRRGCLKGETEPTASLSTKDVYSKVIGFQIIDQTITKSRCDENALYASMGKFLDGLKQVQTNPAAGQSQMQAALNDLKAASDPRPDNAPAEIPKPASITIPDENVAKPPAVPTDSQTLEQVLRDTYGVPAGQAKSLVETDSEKIKAMIEKSITNDTAGAQAIARQLNLNDDVIKNIANIEPQKRMTAEEAKQIADAQQQERQSQILQNDTSTFAEKTPMEKAKQAIANIESSGGRYDMLGPVTRNGDRAYGKYQVMGNNVGPWTEQALGVRMSPEQFRADPQAQERVFEHRFQMYADKYGGYENAAKVWFGGPGGLANQYRTDMLGTSVTRYGERFTQYYESGQILSGGRYASGGSSSPFSGITGGNYPTGVSYPTGGTNMNEGSAFGAANLFNFDDSTGSMRQGSGTTGTNSLSSFLSGIISGVSNKPQTQSQNVTVRQIPYQSQQQQAVVSIIAQPQQAFVGNSIVISWSSVGMRNDVPCRTQLVAPVGTTTVAVSNEGSKIITAPEKGIMRFTISCTTLNGTAVTQATNVAVQ